MKQSMKILTSSETNEWYTPLWVIEMVKRVIGEIELDPASHPVPQQWIGATKWYSKEQNGLQKAWEGTVFLNPPYGKTGNRSNQEIWSEKLIQETYNMQIPRAILLTKTVPGYKWWDNLFNGGWPGPCCITRGRIGFVRAITPEGNTTTLSKKGKSKTASTFWYYGADPELFSIMFSEIGRIIPPGGTY